jgi:hypothetical protein
MYPDHFLDVNILIGSRVPTDAQYDKTTTYMQRQQIRRCTSGNGRKLAKNYFDFIRLEAREFLLELAANTKTFPNDDTKIRELIFGSIYDFVERGRLSLTRSKQLISFVTSVKALHHLVAEIQENKRNGVKNYCKYVISAIEHAILTLKQDCNYDVHALIRVYDREAPKGKDKVEYPILRQQLLDIIGDDEDVEIFLDCHDVQNHRIKTSVCFITADARHFLDKQIKPRIQAITPHILIQSPYYRP